MNKMDKLKSLNLEQRKLLFGIKSIIFDSKLLDPSKKPTPLEVSNSFRKDGEKVFKAEAYDYSIPDEAYLSYWELYLADAALHGTPKNGKMITHRDTTKERRKYINKMLKMAKGTPTTEYLKTKFQLSAEYDEICEILDEDIKNLVQLRK